MAVNFDGRKRKVRLSRKIQMYEEVLTQGSLHTRKFCGSVPNVDVIAHMTSEDEMYSMCTYGSTATMAAIQQCVSENTLLSFDMGFITPFLLLPNNDRSVILLPAQAMLASF